MPIDKSEFRKVMAQFAAGVTVVTTTGADGAPYGLTATAFTSVSLQPPLVLVCVDKKSETYPHFASGVFAVNFLAVGQQDLSQRFATSGGDKFQGVDFRRGAVGAPLLSGTIACVECRIVSAYDGGDHTIYVGEVESANVSEGAPLLHFRGAYATVGKGQ